MVGDSHLEVLLKTITNHNFDSKITKRNYSGYFARFLNFLKLKKESKEISIENVKEYIN